MKAGRLRHLVSLSRRVAGRDALGQPSVSFAAYATVWGAVEPLKGDEFFASEKFVDRVDSRIIIRYRADVQPKDRVEWNGHVYDVQSVINVEERNRELQMMAKEVW